MVKDRNENFNSADVYFDSLNGRLIFNEDNNTLAWETAKGTKVVFALASNEQPVGSCEINNKLVVLSTDGTNSRILVITENLFGQYVLQELFNDAYDPNGDFLNFRNRCEVHGIVENAGVERIYWNDDRNDPRVFNIMQRDASGNLIVAPYPSYFSVHSMDLMMDLQWGVMRYVGNVSGNLKVGKRQYFYRYIHQNGYTSPWGPLSDGIFVTSDAINNENWNEYEMEVSGTPTKKGHRLSFEQIDTRFQQIEVGCVYWETEQAFTRAYVFGKFDITSDDIYVNHLSDTGIDILEEEINQRYFDCMHSKAQNIKNNYYHQGNIYLRPQPQIAQEILDEITIEPVLRKMLSDTTENAYTLPVTHQDPYNTTVTKQVFGSVTEVLPIVGDYLNYKGTQWEHLFKGYFRGSIYPYCIVVWDKKGQPCFAQYIADFLFPEQFSNQWEKRTPSGTVTGTTGALFDYTLTTQGPAYALDQITDTVQQGDYYALTIMGARFSGIDLTDILYDDNGKQNISGFSIVRSDRVPDIICQGLLMNCTVEINTKDGPLNYPNGIPKVQPLHSHGNYYLYKNIQPNIKPYYSQNELTANVSDDMGATVLRGIYTTQDIFTFESPDFLINGAVLDSNNTEYLRLVGNCQLAWNSPREDGSPIYPLHSYASSFYGNNRMFNTKHYSTRVNGLRWMNDLDGIATAGTLFNGPFGMWGTERKVVDMKAPVYDEGALGIGNGYYNIQNEEVYLNQYGSFNATTTTNRQARGHQNTIFMNAPLGNLSSVYQSWDYPLDMVNNRSCYFIANYRTGLDGYVLTDSVVKNRIYKNIGHFIPINSNTIADATQIDGRVVFNDVEVWGGDCFVDFFDYCRLMPLYEAGPVAQKDYSMGLIFPVESQYNFTMKKGKRYAKVGARPQVVDAGVTVGGDDNILMNDGVFASRVDPFYRNLEEFNVNRSLQQPSVNVSVNKYFIKNDDIVDRIDFPLMYIHSELKYLGEQYDSFRKFKVNNFYYADGKFGAITKLGDLFDNNYIIQQGAVSKMLFNEKTLLSTDNKQLAVGTGAGYQGQDYIHTDYGSQHQWSVVFTGRSIYGVDAHKGKQWRFGQDGFNLLSDLAGVHNWFTEATKYYWMKPETTGDFYERNVNEGNFDDARLWGGIHSIFDYKNNSLITTFSNYKTYVRNASGQVVQGDTIEYSEESNKYITRHSFIPYIYMGLKRSFYSPNPAIDGNIYIHDEGSVLNIYDTLQPASLTFNATPNGIMAKVFDNVRLNVNETAVPFLTSLTMVTDANDPHVITFATDDRQEYREGFLVFPTNEIDKNERLRGKYCRFEYVFNKFVADSESVVIPMQESDFRISKKY